jgi:HSP20 family protein
MMITDLLPWKKSKKNEVQVKRKDSDNPFDLLHQKLNNLFSDFFGDFGDLSPTLSNSNWGVSGLTPRFDIAEDDKHLEVTAELPGMEKNDVEVTIDHNMLIIHGEKKEETENRKKNYYVSERRYGRFSRSFNLPTDLDLDKLEANFKKGVLSVTIPKTEEAKQNRRKIEISS